MGETDPLTHPWQPSQVEVMHALRACLVAVGDLDRHLATWTGLPTTDAAALSQLVWADADDAPLSPAELGRRVGLTSGATTALVDRLAARGHVVRSRESTDRRRVTLRPTPEARESARAFLAVAGTEVAALLRETPPDVLATAARFLDDLARAATAGSQRLARSSSARS